MKTLAVTAALVASVAILTPPKDEARSQPAAAKVATAAPLAVVAQQQQASGFGTPLTVTVSGTGIVDGTYVVQEQPSLSPDARYWHANLGGGAAGWIKVYRGLLPDRTPGWGANVGLTTGNAAGATSGYWVGGVTISGMRLTGADFDCSGSAGWVGSPVLNGSPTNGGRVITVEVRG
jgi:hypothetical protein